MAQTISLMGASYPDVPAVTLPKSGGGTATFTDTSDTTAVASDVASGKYFYDATGEKKQGTASGGGASIDDTAGAGDTDKAWSADKLTSEFSDVLNQITVCKVDANLLGSNIPGTTATVTMDGNGNPTSIVHTANNSAVRTDTFVWSANSVVETRTLASGKYITLTTNLTTLETVVSAVQEVA